MGAETSLLRPSHHARIYEVDRGERRPSIGRKETAIPSLTKPSNISSPTVRLSLALNSIGRFYCGLLKTSKTGYQ
jgi:hypothetical protein